MTQKSPTPFKLATLSTAGCAPFAALVVAERAYSLRLVSRHLQRSGRAIHGAESMLEMLQTWQLNLPLLQEVAEQLTNGGAPELAADGAAVGTLRFHAPVQRPQQIFCAGANYKKHVVQILMAQVNDQTKNMNAEERLAYGQKMMDERAERGTPFFFVKALSTLTGPFDAITLPHDVQQPDWELELAVVIGRTARRVSRESALDYVAGYTIANDITARDRLFRKPGDLRELGMDIVACKCAPSFLPVGPYLVPATVFGNPQRQQITLKLNGEIKQDESTEDMIFGVARLIADLSQFAVLNPGDLICTGSPAGNGVHFRRFLQAGDVVEGTISGIGTQRNSVIAEPT